MRSGIKIQYDDAEIGEPMETKLNSMFSARYCALGAAWSTCMSGRLFPAGCGD